MPKALPQMNAPLTPVFSAITGATGLASSRAMAAGEREPVQLARFRDPCCIRSTEEIATAWTGHDRPAQVFALTQALAWYDAYAEQVRACAVEIAEHFQAIRPAWPDALPPVDRGTNAGHTARMGPSMRRAPCSIS